MTQPEPIDVVFTWVDDTWPGYLELLNRHASDRRDLNPNRTRDNLDLIRYALRAVHRWLPQARRIHLFTARPQVPRWLDRDHPRVALHHHDAVIDADHLPTFSSFAIVSHLHLLPGLAERYLYIEDDCLLNGPGLVAALTGPDGRPKAHFGKHWILPRDKLNPETSSPWNLALAHADAILSHRFGPGPRRQSLHGPILFDRATVAACIADYPELFAATRAEKFRSARAVPPEVFIPHYAAATGRWHSARRAETARVEGYVSLENLAPWTWAQLTRAHLRQPLSIALNDSFEDRPNPRVETMVRRWLDRRWPTPAPWERDATK